MISTAWVGEFFQRHPGGMGPAFILRIVGRHRHPSRCWSIDSHVLTLMREHYYSIYLYMPSVDVLMHAVDLHKTASQWCLSP